MIHVIGAGGIGMSGVAEALWDCGFTVTGSDAAAGENASRLRARGIPVANQHAADNLGRATAVVASSAIAPDNPEVAAARAGGLPVYHRADILALLAEGRTVVAVAGAHGKTTTAALIAHILEVAGFDPSAVLGGVQPAWQTNVRVGRGAPIVLETDESDGSFLRVCPHIGVVTNVDSEHAAAYGGFKGLRDAFLAFVERAGEVGTIVACADDPALRALLARARLSRLITYGTRAGADVCGHALELGPSGCDFDLVTSLADERAAPPRRMRTAMLGFHNLQNALGAVAAARELGVRAPAIRRALETFPGVERRLTPIGSFDGVTIYDDYAHHPAEVGAALRAVRGAARGRVIAVFQPHRYTRLREHFAEFCESLDTADAVAITEVYAAGERPLSEFDRDHLVDALRARGHPCAIPLAGAENLPVLIRALSRPGDVILCMGAGNITAWARALPAQLAALADADRTEIESSRARAAVPARKAPARD